MRTPGRMKRRQLVASGIRRQRRRFVVLALVTAMSTGSVAVGLSLGSYVATEVDQAVETDSPLRTVTVYNDQTPLPSRVLSELEALPDVEEAIPVLRVPAGLDHSRSSVTLMNLPSRNDVPIVGGGVPAGGLADDEIILPASADGVNLQDLLGTTTAITYTEGVDAGAGVGRSMNLNVVAIFDPSFQVDAPIAAYVSQSLAQKLAAARIGVPEPEYLSTIGYDQVVVIAESTAAVDGVTRAIQDLGYHAVSQLQQMSQVPGVIQLVRGATTALFALLLIISGGCAFAIAHATAAERSTEVATLKTFGWSAARVRGLFVSEAGVVATSAAVFGAAVGTGLAVWAGGPLRTSVAGDQFGPMVVPVLQVVAAVVVSAMAITAVYALAVGRTTRRPVADVFRDAL